jgi:hypothetical protein
MQFRMTADVHQRLLNLGKLTGFTPHTLGSMALAVGVNALEQSLMAATGDATIEELARAMGRGVRSDLDALGKAFGEK